ncbi:MAG TPA: FG-GAP-like repeat-containing protein [Sphingomicrobium sp.]|nr:FG-GAP-like repeat-containing protein [Sphingomicrobium sp.]
MADIPGNSTTTATITVGGTVSGTLETLGDHDWFRIQLTAGQSITITLNGVTLVDPYLGILNSSGVSLQENDDISSGVNRDSRIGFTATTSGTYYIDASAWQDNYTGTYQLQVTPYTPPPVWTYDQIANQLVSGYWGGTTHRFNVAPGGQLTVNVTALTPAGQNLARAALATWTDITGIRFVEVGAGGQIVFDDNEDGAHASSSYSGSFITSSRVNVGTDWLTSYGTAIGGYSYQTYMHEIGHALGLGHAGNYNGDANYLTDALYANDSWATTVMSYFSQTENTYFSGLGFNRNFLLTPMLADIVAMQRLYGLSTTTRSGDTTYGFNSNAGSIYNASITTNGAYTIFDVGGTDTLDFSGYAVNQRIDLNPESFSNIGGRTGNVAIARGTIIENAIGGSRADVIIGNSAANVLTGSAGIDTLTGGAGNDTFQDTKAGLNGDAITDFAIGDRIVITDATLAGFTVSLSGTTLTYTGGSVTLGTPVSGTITASAAASGGVQLVISTTTAPPAGDARNDFNGDGRSDVLWRHDDGTITNWLGQASGGFADNSVNGSTTVPTIWQIEGTGDFNGDGRVDILWRHANGTITNWLGQANGGHVNNAVSGTTVPTAWHIQGIGDFNGDGRDDILWRHDDGTITNWLGQANGSFVNNPNAATSVPTQWHIIGTGDFNGDGRDDILWRHVDGTITNWLGQANGGFVNNPNAATSVPTQWHIEGIGDFNGDGRDDILWRHDNGVITNWLGQANGGITDNSVNASTSVLLSWQIDGIGDFNGDGRDDILWRNADGTLTNWLGQTNGGLVNNPNAATWVPTAWHIQTSDIFYL